LRPRVPLSAVSRHFPDHALRSEPAVDLRVNAFTAVVNVKALTALLTESLLIYLTDRDCLSVGVISTLHSIHSFE